MFIIRTPIFKFKVPGQKIYDLKLKYNFWIIRTFHISAFGLLNNLCEFTTRENKFKQYFELKMSLKRSFKDYGIQK